MNVSTGGGLGMTEKSGCAATRASPEMACSMGSMTRHLPDGE